MQCANYLYDLPSELIHIINNMVYDMYREDHKKKMENIFAILKDTRVMYEEYQDIDDDIIIISLPITYHFNMIDYGYILNHNMHDMEINKRNKERKLNIYMRDHLITFNNM